MTPLIVQKPEVSKDIEIPEITAELKIPCKLQYPLSKLNPEGDLRQLATDLIVNLGQVKKCYDKDAALIREIKQNEEILFKFAQED